MKRSTFGPKCYKLIAKVISWNLKCVLKPDSFRESIIGLNFRFVQITFHTFFLWISFLNWKCHTQGWNNLVIFLVSLRFHSTWAKKLANFSKWIRGNISISHYACKKVSTVFILWLNIVQVVRYFWFIFKVKIFSFWNT